MRANEFINENVPATRTDTEREEAQTAYMHGLKHGREGVGNNMDRAQAEWGNDFKHYNAGFLQGRNQKAKDLKAAGQGYGKRDQGVAENFADGRNPQDKGDSQRHGIPKGATMAQLEKASHAAGRKGQLARWQLNMRRGKKK